MSAPIFNMDHIKQTEEITQLTFMICVDKGTINAKNLEHDILYQGTVSGPGNEPQRCTTRMITDIIVFAFDAKCSYLTIVFNIETGEEQNVQAEASMTLARAPIPYAGDTRYVKIMKPRRASTLRTLINDPFGVKFCDVVYTLYSDMVQTKLQRIVEREQYNRKLANIQLALEKFVAHRKAARCIDLR